MDFGSSTVVSNTSFDPAEGYNGTFGYMAPELFSDGAEVSKEADMYAFGMVVYEVVTGTRPFGYRRHLELPALTIGGSRPARPEDPVDVGFGHGTWGFIERSSEG